MKTICAAIALTIAIPALASAQPSPAAPAAPQHGRDDQHMDHKDMDCEKMKAEGKKMDCCEKHAKDAKDEAAAAAHAGHGGMQD